MFFCTFFLLLFLMGKHGAIFGTRWPFVASLTVGEEFGRVPRPVSPFNDSNPSTWRKLPPLGILTITWYPVNLWHDHKM